MPVTRLLCRQYLKLHGCDIVVKEFPLVHRQSAELYFP